MEVWNNKCTIILESCTDTDNGHLDKSGNSCNWYVALEYLCGKDDDDDFKSNLMCCFCGGGTTG